MVQWPRFHAPNVEDQRAAERGEGSIPGQGIRSHTPQLKILHTPVQPNKYFFKKERKRDQICGYQRQGLGG